MYEGSKHTTWLLVALVITLLLSSLILGWLLTHSPVFAKPSLANSALLTQASFTTSTTALPIITEPIKSREKPSEATIDSAYVFSILDSAEQLDQAAITPDATLPLASLAANLLNPKLPKTTAPSALTTQGLSLKVNDQLKTGWIYAGQFQNEKWNLVSINLGSDQLPMLQASYPLVWGTNIRSAPPSARMNGNNQNLAKPIGYLAAGSKIQVLSVKPSGKNGHIWLEISYGE